ncbi:MAG: hypothetical protein HY294_13775 [Candidatus Rokubacteria bacterium]|nr:hypothetical protein [Candidatus Rokubacteria bacterium]
MASLLFISLCLAITPVAMAHHVGVYTPRDNEISANFKQIKFSLQAGKTDVARRLFDEGALRREMVTRAATLPPGLEAAVEAALRRGDRADSERGLVVFFAALSRDLALEADRQLGDAASPAPARVAAGRRFLEAIWRYYSLIDFAVTQADAKAAVAIRLAYDEADGAARTPDPERLRAPLRRIAQALDGVVATSPLAGRASRRTSRGPAVRGERHTRRQS